MGWEEAYKRAECLWGLKPDDALVNYASLVPKGKILDLGIGEGRNALFFALMGYEVEGVDLSRTAVERCIERAKAQNLKVKAEVRDLREVRIPEGSYSLIIAAWVLNFFKRSETDRMIDRIKAGVKKDGLIYLGVFSIDDPGYERAKARLKPVEGHTFYSPKMDSYIHYFTRDEIDSSFADFKTILFSSGIELDITHDQPHHHGFIKYLGQKR